MQTHLRLDDAAIHTLPDLFEQRVLKSPESTAYHHFDIGRKRWCKTTWSHMAKEVARWQLALQKEELQQGDRVGIMLKNCREWVVFDQAALALGLVVVPMYPEDRPDNVSYIVQHAEIKLLVVEGRRQWQRLQTVSEELEGLQRIVAINTIEADDEPKDPRLESLSEWLFGCQGDVQHVEIDAEAMATLVYTSGTTGRPKGVMLSHKNIISNLKNITNCIEFQEGDRFLSFLPLSHMLERTAGYYLPMYMGSEVAFSRSIAQLGSDLVETKPTLLISVPRIYEQVYAKIMDNLRKQPEFRQKLFHKAVETGWHWFEYSQGRDKWGMDLLLWPILKKLVASKVMEKLGGEMRYAVCGGAPLPPKAAKLFVGLGLNVLHGYGMTEASPVVAVNRPRNNIPKSIGQALDNLDVKIGEHDELLVRGDSVMMGYWKNEEATQSTVDGEGWLRSGDQASMDEDGHIYITGRLKEIIVLGNGEKVPPSDMEMAITTDPLIEQVMIVGEGKSCLAAVAVLNPEAWNTLADELGVDPEEQASMSLKFVEKAVLARMSKQLKGFPGYAQIRRVTMTLEPWTVDNGLLTPTLKVKRPQVTRAHQDDIDALYTGRYA